MAYPKSRGGCTTFNARYALCDDHVAARTRSRQPSLVVETLDSLLAETLTEFEIVISDNASTDRTPEICHSYRAKDSRIRYSRNDRNIGQAPKLQPYGRAVPGADSSMAAPTMIFTSPPSWSGAWMRSSEIRAWFSVTRVPS
jgi:hypothetical protein